MEILVIGGGGREHAIIHCLNKSSKVAKIYCAPSNAGINDEAEEVRLEVDNFSGIADFLASHSKITLTVVAPDNPLVGGLVNYLEDRGHRVFGPRAEAAIIEGSKIFSKQLMQNYNIPTAKYATFSNYPQALDYVAASDYPLVIKADGLAFGKGVIICQNINDATAALNTIMLQGAFGASNTTVIIEEFLTGREVSVLAFTDGKTVIPMLSSQDHKKAFDGDKGANTGGMGAFCPSPFYTKELAEQTYNNVILPTIAAMNDMGRTFKGVLYFGLMLVGDKVYTLEYNARFGDPETQAVLPLLKTDLVDIMIAVIEEKLADINIEWSEESCVTVVCASGGYPASYPKGKIITIGDTSGTTVYHAGTKLVNGDCVTNGGRVLAVSATGKDIAESREKVYKTINNISFEGMFFRKDIGNI